jgi:hypothetical protein
MAAEEKYKEFEEWLMQVDTPPSEATTLERWLDYLAEEHHIVKGAQEIAKEVFSERFELWEELGIKEVKITRMREGEPFTEYRYGIAGNPGLWGRESMLLFAEAMAEEEGLLEMAERIRAIRREEYGGE